MNIIVKTILENISTDITPKATKRWGIVSSNHIKLINTILKRYSMGGVFYFVIGDINLNGKDKTLARLNDVGVNLEQSWYIGGVLPAVMFAYWRDTHIPTPSLADKNLEWAILI